MNASGCVLHMMMGSEKYMLIYWSLPWEVAGVILPILQALKIRFEKAHYLWDSCKLLSATT